MTAFREPTVKYGHRTLTAIVVILGVLLVGIAYLSRAYGIGAMDQEQEGYRSVLSQLAAAVVGTLRSETWHLFLQPEGCGPMIAQSERCFAAAAPFGLFIPVCLVLFRPACCRVRVLCRPGSCRRASR
jgi:hypothetical protein